MDRGPWWATVHGIHAESHMTEHTCTHTHTHIYTHTKHYIVLCNVFSSVQWLSHVRLFVTPWTAPRQASLSVSDSWRLLKLMPMSFTHAIFYYFKI